MPTLGSDRGLTYSSILVLLLGLVWIWVSRMPTGSRTGDVAIAPGKGFIAPDFTLEALNNEAFSLAALRGSPVLVNFWATWCPPCRSEMPAMQRVYDEYASQGFTILAVNNTSEDSRQAVLEFVQEYQLTFPVLYDEDGSTVRTYQVSALPTSFFIAADGTIHEVIVGGPMAEALLRARIESLLKGPD